MPKPAATGAFSPLAPRECRVLWATNADSGPLLESLLSPVEHERSRAYLRPDDRRRFIAGAATLRRAAADGLSVSPEHLRVDRRCRTCGAEHGKPRLSDHPHVDVSVSHAGERVVVALARGARVGVDVEQVRAIDVEELARTAFASDKVAALPADTRRLPPATRASA